MENGKPKFFYGYVVVAAAFSIMTIAWGINRTFGVFLEPMLNEFGWTRAGISGAFTLVILIGGGMSLVAGRLTDQYGPRIVLICCGLFLSLSYILVSQVKAIWQFYLFYGLIAGLGMSGCIAPLMSTIARWFVKRRALMSGILVSGPALGIVFMPLLSSIFISAYGWRISYLILGTMVLMILVSGALFLKRDPGEMGLVPYGTDKATAVELDLQNEGLSLSEAIRTRQFWLLNYIAFGDFYLINVIAVHIVIHAIGLGIQPTAAASILSLAAGVSIPARIIIGGVADKIGSRSAFMICLIMSVIAFLLLLVARELWTLYLFAVIYGFGLWAGGGIMSPMAADLFGLKSHGAIYAGTTFAFSIGGALGPVLVGYLFDVTGSYGPGFLTCTAISITCLMAIIYIRPIKKSS
jgi:MFS family permease